jgi:divinyl protochlorophyllide a 8-vinyl-reductase
MSSAARIGPNAIIQVAAALVQHVGAVEANAVMVASTWSLQRLPTAMVEEREVAALMRAVAERFPGELGHRIVCDGGVRTADYLLRARIPAMAQWVLARLPARLALRILLAAIARHAWTFAGSARFIVAREGTGRMSFALGGCPVCRGRGAIVPQCAYYAATVERLVRVLISPVATVHEVQCEAMGDAACRFEIVLGVAPSDVVRSPRVPGRPAGAT